MQVTQQPSISQAGHATAAGQHVGQLDVLVQLALFFIGGEGEVRGGEGGGEGGKAY